MAIANATIPRGEIGLGKAIAKHGTVRSCEVIDTPILLADTRVEACSGHLWLLCDITRCRHRDWRRCASEHSTLVSAAGRKCACGGFGRFQAGLWISTPLTISWQCAMRLDERRHTIPSREQWPRIALRGLACGARPESIHVCSGACPHDAQPTPPHLLRLDVRITDRLLTRRGHWRLDHGLRHHGV